MQQDDGNGGVRADEVLQVRGGRLGEGDVVISEPSVELNRLLVPASGIPDQRSRSVDNQAVQADFLQAIEIQQGKVGDDFAKGPTRSVLVRVEHIQTSPVADDLSKLVILGPARAVTIDRKGLNS
jgi:hypothetical protein